ncbi:MAG: oxidoreductase, partial [Candidatus Marinimicrobia bacterium]|nr:oxidoreductase [Candidatus Neomarinimicrobiota bacterium]
MDFNILSWLIWVPVAGALVIVALPRDKKDVIKWVAASFTGLQLIFAIVLWMNFDKDFVGFQFMEKA